MPYLLIKITAKIPLPKSAGAAVAETIRAHAAMGKAVSALQGDAIFPEWSMDQYHEDAEPPPAPKPRGRRPRAELGSNPLAQEQIVQSAREVPHVGNHELPPRHSTTGPDGEDLLHIPESMRVKT